MKIYVPRLLREKLPNDAGTYFATDEGQPYSSHYVDYFNNIVFPPDVTHWLESIELPDDVEIQNACINPYRSEADNQHFYDNGFEDGAEYILKHIKE